MNTNTTSSSSTFPNIDVDFLYAMAEQIQDNKIAADIRSDYSVTTAAPVKKVTPMKTATKTVKAPKSTTRRIYGLFANKEALPFYVGSSKLDLDQRLQLHRTGNRPTQAVIHDFECDGYTVSIQEVAVVTGSKFEANMAEANVYNYYAAKGAQMMNDPSKFSKMTKKIISTIRLLNRHNVKVSNIAREVGLSSTVVRDVILGNTFRNE